MGHSTLTSPWVALVWFLRLRLYPKAFRQIEHLCLNCRLWTTSLCSSKSKGQLKSFSQTSQLFHGPTYLIVFWNWALFFCVLCDFWQCTCKVVMHENLFLQVPQLSSFDCLWMTCMWPIKPSNRFLFWLQYEQWNGWFSLCSTSIWSEKPFSVVKSTPHFLHPEILFNIWSFTFNLDSS